MVDQTKKKTRKKQQNNRLALKRLKRTRAEIRC